MALSSSLVKKFVEVTTEAETSTGHYVYGTAIVNGDNKYVQIDGSESLTSVSVATDITTGDRVLLYIENHTASVIGNITCPASGRGAVNVENMLADFETLVVGELYSVQADINTIYADYVSTEYLDAYYVTSDYIATNYITAETAYLTYATIENLTALKEYVDSLEASEITVEYLEAHFANLDDFIALSGTVTDLESWRITTDNLLAGFASIEDLQAVYAYIYDLDADFANIKNLLSGVAGVGDLTAIYLTADNVVIEDALITNAMIANVSADKITAGTIYTSKVRIQTAEEDESLYIDNSLIQMSENDLVRLQAGKDATGEYNFYIWNSEGELMFDATGATAEGIGKEVIVNTHVAEDANIAGYKLDIASVASELNEDGSLTVDASQVYIDGTRLDYELEEITDLIAGVSMEGLKNFTVYYAIGDSDTEPPFVPEDIVPALTDVAETDYSFTDVYDEFSLWSTTQPQAEEGEYVWIVYFCEYVDGSTAWSDPMCLTDGFLRRQTNYIFTELEVIQGEISAKVWMEDVKEYVSTEVSGVLSEIDITVGQITEKVESITYDLENIYVTKASLVLQINPDTGHAEIIGEADYIYLYGNQIVIQSDNFSLLEDGNIISTSGLIGGWTIGEKSLYNGTDSMTSITNGTYIGVDGIRQYFNSSQFVNIEDGTITAYGAIINGELKTNNIYGCSDDKNYEFWFGTGKWRSLDGSNVPYYGTMGLLSKDEIYANASTEEYEYITSFISLNSMSDYSSETPRSFSYDLNYGIKLYSFHTYEYPESGVLVSKSTDITIKPSDIAMHVYGSESSTSDMVEVSIGETYPLYIYTNKSSPQIVNKCIKSSTSVSIQCIHNNGTKVSLHVGSGGSNRGVYDDTNSSWIVYADSSNDIHLGPSTVGGAYKPIYLSSGIPTKCTFMVQYGSVSMSTISSGATGTSSVTFGSSFGSTPRVFCSIVPGSTTGSGWTEVSANPTSISTTGFTILFCNNYSSSLTPTVHWFAVGNS